MGVPQGPGFRPDEKPAPGSLAARRTAGFLRRATWPASWETNRRSTAPPAWSSCASACCRAPASAEPAGRPWRLGHTGGAVHGLRAIATSRTAATPNSATDAANVRGQIALAYIERRGARMYLRLALRRPVRRARVIRASGRIDPCRRRLRRGRGPRGGPTDEPAHVDAAVAPSGRTVGAWAPRTAARRNEAVRRTSRRAACGPAALPRRAGPESGRSGRGASGHSRRDMSHDVSATVAWSTIQGNVPDRPGLPVPGLHDRRRRLASTHRMVSCRAAPSGTWRRAARASSP